MFERFLEDAGADKTNLFEVFSACLGRNVLMQKRAGELVVTDDANVDPAPMACTAAQNESFIIICLSRTASRISR